MGFLKQWLELDPSNKKYLKESTLEKPGSHQWSRIATPDGQMG